MECSRSHMFLLFALISSAVVALHALQDVTDDRQNIEHEEYKTGRFPLLMPNVRPTRPELYLCTPVKVDYSRNYFITGYEPKGKMHTAHHILLYGCGEPGNRKSVWNCGEMASSDTSTEEDAAPPCGRNAPSQIIYAWARDAPRLELPEGVGFKVGKDSPIKYIVLQVHYATIDAFKDGSTDNSGVYLEYTMKPLTKLAGVFLLGTDGVIPPMATENMESMCEMTEKKKIYPFAYRTHTHGLGKVVAGYRVRSDEHGRDIWTQLGKRDPLTPQMFYPIENKEPIIYGDRLAARCTMKSNRHRYTFIGATNEDEMCNFYIMYYVENDEPLQIKYCFSEGPPNYYWRNPDVALNNIPEKEASTL